MITYLETQILQLENKPELTPHGKAQFPASNFKNHCFTIIELISKDQEMHEHE